MVPIEIRFFRLTRKEVTRKVAVMGGGVDRSLGCLMRLLCCLLQSAPTIHSPFPFSESADLCSAIQCMHQRAMDMGGTVRDGQHVDVMHHAYTRASDQHDSREQHMCPNSIYTHSLVSYVVVLEIKYT